MAKRTSVIIPCWVIDDNLLHLTQRCLHQVTENSNVELIVIDNGSTIGNNYMREMSDIYIYNSTNLGYTEAMNQGIKLSHCEYIVCGNNDYFVEPGWEDILIEVLEGTQTCTTVTPNTQPHAGDEEVWSIDLPGSWFLMRKKDMYKYGLLDEQFRIVHSDADLASKILEDDNRMCETNLTKAEHYGGASLARMKDNNNEFIHSFARYLKKWGKSE